jgi:hypothetical protein
VLDDTSTGVPLASSLRRSPAALERLGGVVALTTRSRVSVGTAVVPQGNRRLVAPQWCRGLSSLQRGGKWVS